MENHNRSLKAEYLMTMYREIARLGTNERETTSLVRHTQTGKIAVKKVVAREKLEIYRKLKELPHHNLVPIYEVEDCGEYGIIIEAYISGETLEDKILSRGHLSEEETLRIMEQLVGVLQIIHQQGIIHRDINPKNILISVDGVLKLIDFGIARTPQEEKSQDTTILGTVGYASPEQYGFQQTDVRTDVYAVGVLLNVMLTGKLPNQVRYSQPPFAKVIQRATAIDPDRRYSSMAKLSLELFGNQEKKKAQIIDEKKIPGFRTGVTWKKITACVGYGLMLFYSVFSITECASTPLTFLLETIAVLTYIWLGVLILVNCWGWDTKVWLIRRLPREIRITLRIIVWMFCFYFGYLLETYVRYTMLGMTRPS